MFIDFAASSCKNCIAMDQTVFNTAEIKRKRQDFVVVHCLAEQPKQAAALQGGIISIPVNALIGPNHVVQSSATLDAWVLLTNLPGLNLLEPGNHRICPQI